MIIGLGGKIHSRGKTEKESWEFLDAFFNARDFNYLSAREVFLRGGGLYDFDSSQDYAVGKIGRVKDFVVLTGLQDKTTGGVHIVRFNPGFFSRRLSKGFSYQIISPKNREDPLVLFKQYYQDLMSRRD